MQQEDQIDARLAKLGIERPGVGDPIRDDPTFRSLVSKVDAVIDEHRVHMATVDARDEGFDSLRADLTARELQDALGGRPDEEGAIATERGVIRVGARFDQARGLDGAAEAALLSAGYRDAEAVRRASPDVLVRLTGLDHEAVTSAQADLDLTQLDGVDAEVADLLRLVDVHSVSRLASRDPEELVADMRRVVQTHGLERLPAALSDLFALGRLVQSAKAALV